MANITVEIIGKFDKFNADFKKSIENATKGMLSVGKGGTLALGIPEKFAGMGGMIGNIGKIAGFAGVAGIAINQVLELLGKIKNYLAAASPALKGTFDIISRSFMYMFKPFGDFVAVILRPLAIVLFRFAVGFHRVMQELGKGISGGFADIGKAFDKFADKPFEAIFDMSKIFGGGIWDIGFWIGEQLAKVTVGIWDIGFWLGEQLAKVTKGIFNMGFWIGEQLAEITTGIFDIGVWLGEETGKVVTGVFDVGKWISEQLAAIITGTFKIGEWISEQLGKIVDMASKFNLVGWILGVLGSIVDTAIKFDVVGWIKEVLGRFMGGTPRSEQTGTNYIPETGLYMLHRGETVSPSPSSSGRKIDITNNFNVNQGTASKYGNSGDLQNAIETAARNVALSQRTVLS